MMPSRTRSERIGSAVPLRAARPHNHCGAHGVDAPYLFQYTSTSIPAVTDRRYKPDGRAALLRGHIPGGAAPIDREQAAPPYHCTDCLWELVLIRVHP